MIDITGQRKGAVVIISRLPPAGDNRGARWLARCDCGREITVISVQFRRGHYQSCGCLKSQLISNANTRHGAARDGRETPEYRAWCSMVKRCHSPTAHNYALYGGRGIAVCERWRSSFAAFLADVGPRPSPRHSLDRIDNNGNYEPGNVRWATAYEQYHNRRPRSEWRAGQAQNTR